MQLILTPYSSHLHSCHLTGMDKSCGKIWVSEWKCLYSTEISDAVVHNSTLSLAHFECRMSVNSKYDRVLSVIEM